MKIPTLFLLVVSPFFVSAKCQEPSSDPPLTTGLTLIYELQPWEKGVVPKSAWSPLGEDVLRRTAEIFTGRLTGLGLRDLKITPAGATRIRVQVPQGAPIRESRLQKVLLNSGRMELRMLLSPIDDLGFQEEVAKFESWRERMPHASVSVFNSKAEEQGGPRAGIYWYGLSDELKADQARGGYMASLPISDLFAVPVRIERVLSRDRQGNSSWDFSQGDLKNVSLSKDARGMDAVYFELADERKEAFHDWTREFERRQLGIFLDGRLHVAPGIREPLRGEGIIVGGVKSFSPQEARDLIVILSHGVLPAKVKLVETKTF